MDDKFNKVIGERIRYLRQKNDMTQMDFAKLMGLRSSGIISQVETGERGLKRENIFKAAQIFGVEPAVLMADVQMSDEDLDMHVAFAKLLAEKENNPEKKSYFEAIKKLLNQD